MTQDDWLMIAGSLAVLGIVGFIAGGLRWPTPYRLVQLVIAFLLFALSILFIRCIRGANVIDAPTSGTWAGGFYAGVLLFLVWSAVRERRGWQR